MNNKTMLQVTARLVHDVPIHQITRRFTHNFVTNARWNTTPVNLWYSNEIVKSNNETAIC